MGKISKKEKTVKLDELEKMKEYVKQYDTVVIVENNDIQNVCLQTLRSSIEGKVVFAKKSILQRYFPALCSDKNFFLIFTNSSEVDKIRSFNFVSFLEAGDSVSENIVISAGLIKNPKLHPFLKPLEHKGANVYLTQDFIVASAGEPLDEKAAKILRIRGERLIQKPITILDAIETKSLQNLEK